MLSGWPFALGYPSDHAQSAYYPGEKKLTKEEISLVSKVLEKHKIEPENTRLDSFTTSLLSYPIYVVRQASATKDPDYRFINKEAPGIVWISNGDHCDELEKVCESLLQAKGYTENETQAEVIDSYIRSFNTGEMKAFRDAQKAWVRDKAPVVETIMGFVEPYRDPHGVRCEWEGIVGISDPIESRKMRNFVDESSTFIRLLPWAVPGENDGKGPFQKDVFVAPDFTSIYST